MNAIESMAEEIRKAIYTLEQGKPCKAICEKMRQKLDTALTAYQAEKALLQKTADHLKTLEFLYYDGYWLEGIETNQGSPFTDMQKDAIEEAFEQLMKIIAAYQDEKNGMVLVRRSTVEAFLAICKDCDKGFNGSVEETLSDWEK